MKSDKYIEMRKKRLAKRAIDIKQRLQSYGVNPNLSDFAFFVGCAPNFLYEIIPNEI